MKPSIAPGSADGDRILEILGRALASYDSETGEHCTRVGDYAVLTGELLGLDRAALDALRWIGVLHDLGKLAVPEALLNKPAQLTPAEQHVMRRHPIVGSEILRSISPELAPVALAVRAHHERWDGNGYPDGLKGDAIPLLGRIACVADVFDSLTHARPYRTHALAVWEAIAFMRANRGRQFDPDVIDVVFNSSRVVAS